MVNRVSRRCTPLVVVLMLVTAMLFINVPLSHASPAWSIPVSISPGSDFGRFASSPQIAVDADGHPNAVWTETTEPMPGYSQGQIYYAADQGGGWSDPLLLSAGTISNGMPQIALDSAGWAHVVWEGEEMTGDGYNVYYRTNAGGSWSAPMVLSFNSFDSGQAQIVVDSGDVAHVVWSGSDEGVSKTAQGKASGREFKYVEGSSYFIYYTAGLGAYWSDPVIISDGPDDYQPQIDVDPDGYAHVVWTAWDPESDDIYYNDNVAGTWPEPEVLSDISLDSYDPQIAVDGYGCSHVVWIVYQYDYNEYYDIRYADDVTGSWASLYINEAYDCGSPQIAVDSNGDSHVVYEGRYDMYDYYNDIFYTNNVEGWEWTDGLSSVNNNEYPQVAIGPDDVPQVVWDGNSSESTNNQVYFTTYGTEDWIEPVALSTGLYENTTPQIAVEAGGDAHVVFAGMNEMDRGGIYYATGSGPDWSAPLLISTTAEGTVDNRVPQVAVDADGAVHAVWIGYDGEYEYLYYATNAGGGWSAPVAISDGQWRFFEPPQLALDPDGWAHVIWTGYDENESVCYATNTGGAWSAQIRLNGTTYGGNYPDFTVDGDGAVHVVWSEYNGSSYNLYYTTDAGGSWSPSAVISTNQIIEDPDITLDSDGNCHVAWTGYNGSGYPIFYSTNAGGTWSAPDSLSGTWLYNHYPQVMVDSGGTAHVLWSCHDNLTIQYAKGTAGSWLAPVAAGGGCSYSTRIQAAVNSAGTIHASYYGPDNEGGNVWYLNGGPDPSPWTQTNISGAATGNLDPVLALDSAGNPQVAWSGLDGIGMRQAWYSANNGTAWSTPLVVSTNSLINETPRIAMDPQDRPHAVWAGLDEMMVKRIWYSADNVHNVTASVSGGSGGTVDPYFQQVYDGGTASITLIPDAGYHVGSVTDNGIAVTPTPTASYTISNVTANHDVVVTYVPDKADWYLAEGSTDGGMETWVLVQNPGASAVTVDLTLMTEKGPKVPDALQGVTIPAESRTSFNLNSYVTTYDVSTMVNANGGDVVCERAVYGNSRTWGTDSVGATSPASTWYLAEGSTGGGMETFILVQNPNTTAVYVSLEFMTSAGQVAGPKDFRIPAGTRLTFDAGEYVTDYDLSTVVTSTGGGIVCERSVYGADRNWGTDSIGATAPVKEWYLAEGCTEGGMETWVLVQNPGKDDVTVDLTYMTSAGTLPGPQDFVIPAGTRHSFNVGDTLTSYDVSTVVQASGGVICERAMYGGERTWATDSIGATAPAATWYMAEGCTGGGMETWVLVQNPGTTDITVDLTFMTSGGQVPGPQGFVIPAGTRHSFNVAETVIDYNVSTVVQASGNVVCERAMYGPDRTWATDSIGYTP